ncbi:MAG: cell division protein ZapA [Spirochaetaceae bacterium]|nr:cell division protein ZapA [Spirochaetaceae bacterium]
MGKLQINLLGTSFTIQANEDEEHLQKLLGYYSRIVEDVSKIDSIKTPLQTSILAGIMLCDEVYKEKSNVVAMKKQGAGAANGQAAAAVNDEESAELERRTIAMIDKINRVL